MAADARRSPIDRTTSMGRVPFATLRCDPSGNVSVSISSERSIERRVPVDGSAWRSVRAVTYRGITASATRHSVTFVSHYAEAISALILGHLEKVNWLK